MLGFYSIYRQIDDELTMVDDEGSCGEALSNHESISDDEIEDTTMPLFDPIPQAAPPRSRKGFLVRMIGKISRPQWVERSVSAKSHSYLQRADAETERAAKLSQEVTKVRV